MKKIFALFVAAVLLLAVGCYDPTPYDSEDLEDEFDRGHESGYSDGYNDGYREGIEAGQLSILEADDAALSEIPRSSEYNYFVTKSGKCFHLPSCQYRDKAVYWYKTREEAIADGYRPCSKCNP